MENIEVTLFKLSIESSFKLLEEQIKQKYFEEYNKTFWELEKAYQEYLVWKKLSKYKYKKEVKSLIQYILLQERTKVFKYKNLFEGLLKQNEDLLELSKRLKSENEYLRRKF